MPNCPLNERDRSSGEPWLAFPSFRKPFLWVPSLLCASAASAGVCFTPTDIVTVTFSFYPSPCPFSLLVLLSVHSAVPRACEGCQETQALLSAFILFWPRVEHLHPDFQQDQQMFLGCLTWAWSPISGCLFWKASPLEVPGAGCWQLGVCRSTGGQLSQHLYLSYSRTRAALPHLHPQPVTPQQFLL